MPDKPGLLPSVNSSLDIMAKWYEEVFQLSSPLNPNGASFDRQVIERTRSKLSAYFGENFFIHRFGNDRAIKEVHIVKRLLMNWKVTECINALIEVAALLEYADAHLPALSKQLRQQVDNPDQFNSTLYEVWIAHKLINTGLEYKQDVEIDGVPLDGMLSFNGESFIIECKKLTAPKQTEFDLLRRMAEELKAGQIDVNRINGYKLVVHAQRPAKSNIVHRLGQLHAELRQKCIERDYNVQEILKCAGDQVSLTMIPFGCLDPGDGTDQTTLVVTYVVGPMNSGDSTGSCSVKISLDMSYTNEAVFEKIKGSVQAARRQHKRKGMRVIVFMDSQELPDLQVGILQFNEMLNNGDTRKRILNFLKNDILIVTRRLYSQHNRPALLHVFCPPEDRPLIKVIMEGFVGDQS